jgi:hypothetical protein
MCGVAVVASLSGRLLTADLPQISRVRSKRLKKLIRETTPTRG